MALFVTSTFAQMARLRIFAPGALLAVVCRGARSIATGSPYWAARTRMKIMRHQENQTSRDSEAMAQREESANVLSVTLGVFRGLIYSMFDRSAHATGEVIIMTIMCTRLQDETGSGFLVINLPCESLATPEAATQTIKAFRTFKFPYVCAIRRAGRWLYVGKDSLTAICESTLGQRPNWQEITISMSTAL
jgi:hypothetical protein